MAVTHTIKGLTVMPHRKDEFIHITAGTAPNIETFNVSKVRLAYYSPYCIILPLLQEHHLKLTNLVRASLNFLMNDSKTIELPEICPKIFRHIVQYMNTETIIIPDSDEIILNHQYPTTTPADRHLDLPTLTHIWFMAHYFLIPHAQNIAINLIYHRLDHGLSDPVFSVNEMITAITTASGEDGTVIEDNNKVLRAVEAYMSYHSFYCRWTAEERGRIPRKILEDLLASTTRDNFNKALGMDEEEIVLEMLKDFYVPDIIDDEDPTRGLLPIGKSEDDDDEDGESPDGTFELNTFN